MLDNIALAMDFVIGYIITYLVLETAWHFAACRLQDKTIKPCLFKQVKMVMTAERGYAGRGWMGNPVGRGKQ
jgi:hypothetical protein